MLRKRIFFALAIVTVMLIILLHSAFKQATELHRDPVVLMNKYYRYKNIKPGVAKKSLLIVLNQDNNYLPALKEYSQWLLNAQDAEQALPWLESLHEGMPNDSTYTLQLAYLYYKNGEWQKSKQLLVDLSRQSPGLLAMQIQQAFNAMASYLPYYQFHAVVDYRKVAFKEPDRHAPLKKIAQKNHQRRTKSKIQALKEAGYLAIKQGRRLAAIQYLTQAYALTHESELAMQLGYLYEQIKIDSASYRYFKLATQSGDKQRSLLAENALTNIGGRQTKALPVPYFSEGYITPFSQTRFGLTVVPFYWRAGIEQDNHFNTKEYLFFRRTQDNRSQNLGEISQIYEDNVQITGVGVQLSPFWKLPINFFVEAGEAYDLIDQHRDRWRKDLRGGFLFYQAFGARPAYFDKLRVSPDYYSDWYADVTYFSRYNNNVIGMLRTRQGIRCVQYKSSMLNVYFTGRVIEDTNRVFYNNIAEVGPGVAFIPTNRFNLELRFEHINGAYLPAGGALINPYGKYYTNNLVQLLFYVKL